MDAALLVARLVLAGVFLISGFAKLADRGGARQAVLGFGVPQALAGSVAVTLPFAELVVAGALLVRGTARWGGLGALVLLTTFLVAIAANLARGRQPDCHCFGQLHSTPVGATTLIRNGVLMVLAGLLAWRGPEEAALSLAGVLGTGGVAVVVFFVLLAVVVLEGWLSLSLLRQNGRVLLRLDAIEQALSQAGIAVASPASTTDLEISPGRPVGSPAPDFQLPALDGETHSLQSLLEDGKPLMLVFSEPGCGPCAALMPDVARWQREHSENLSVVVVTGPAGEKALEAGLVTVLLQQGREVADAYGAIATPSAVVVRPDGRIGTPVTTGASAIADLLRQTLGGAQVRQGGGSRLPSGLEPGQRAPALRLPDLDGTPVELADFQGGETIVLFWNPGCGFCEQILPELKAWENTRGDAGPALLVVSTGSVEANAALGFRSRVVLDVNFAVGQAFGAWGTPSAVLVDESGRVASELAAGTDAVLELCRGRRRATAS